MRCEVCGAPPLPRAGSCVFCHSPLAAEPSVDGLLDYLAAHLPEARVKRSGLLRRGPVRDLRLGERRARLRQEALELRPDVNPVDWVDALLADLSRRAAGDGEVRGALTRSGWALR